MQPATLLHDLVSLSARHRPDAIALRDGQSWLDYTSLDNAIRCFANGVLQLGLQRGERIGIYLEKRFEAVIASFGASAAGGVFVPINPVLKAAQVEHILRDCNVRFLLTSPERLALLHDALANCPDLRQLILTSRTPSSAPSKQPAPLLPAAAWNTLLASPYAAPPRLIDADMAAIFYTSGSTGKAKGVVLSHRNLVAGAQSVASYLENRADDVLLAALPLSFDAGFSQLTTAFHAGAQVVLLNYLLPRDVLKALAAHRVSGLTAVPPLYIQLAQLPWPESIAGHLRYFANTGGVLPQETLAALRQRLPSSKPFLMYGLTEAFRSTYLPPEEIDRRPGSIGKAIPNAEILVLRADGTPCAADEPGELVHRGALVGMGYWNDPERTAERYRALPPALRQNGSGLVLPEIAVFSGDTARRDGDGFLYFIGRRDEMIKTSGYRVSPSEVEEIIYATRLVNECAAFGIAHPTLGQSIHAMVTAAGDAPVDLDQLLSECRQRMPAYMLPTLHRYPGPSLPRNANGKIDRQLLAAGLPSAGQAS